MGEIVGIPGLLSIIVIVLASIIGYIGIILYENSLYGNVAVDNIESKCNITYRIFSPGPVGYAISAGYRAPGDTIGAYLYVHEPVSYKFNGSFIVEIYGLSSNGISLILSKTFHANELPVSVEWRIPEIFHPRYTILVLAVENNTVLDCIRGDIRVPEQHIQAIMKLDKNTYHIGETVKLEIINLGETPVSLSRPYEIYYWDNGQWVFADELTPDAWTMELIVLGKYHSFTQYISLENAVPGKYKVVKVVHGEGTNAYMRLEVEFTVVP